MTLHYKSNTQCLSPPQNDTPQELLAIWSPEPRTWRLSLFLPEKISMSCCAIEESVTKGLDGSVYRSIVSARHCVWFLEGLGALKVGLFSNNTARTW